MILKNFLEQQKSYYVLEILRKHDYNVTKTADFLEVSRQTVYRIIKDSHENFTINNN